MKKMLLAVLTLASSCIAGDQQDADAKGGIVITKDGIQFREPVYPDGTDVKLLHELALFFDEREQPRPKEDWENLLARMKKVAMPRMASRVDLKITNDKILNISDEAVLVVTRHLHPLVPQRTMNLEGVEYRAHWLVVKGSFKMLEVGFGIECVVLTEPRLLKDTKR